jgi:hypothetical protein
MKNTNIIAIITSVFTVILIGMVVYIYRTIILPSNLINDLNLLAVVLAGISVFLFPIATNLISYLITYFLDQQHMNKKQSEAFASIEEIKHNIKKESLVLQFKDRKWLLGTGFYDRIYNEASDIRISGILATPLIDYICKKIKKPENWVKQLERREYVSVKILVSSPKAKFIPILEKQEGLPSNTITDSITNNFDKLKTFSELNKKKLPHGSSISIRAIEDIQYFNLTYAGNTVRKDTDKLLISFSFNKNAGPVYEVPQINDVSTYEECLRYFERLYNDNEKTEIFRWDENGVKFTPEK